MAKVVRVWLRMTYRCCGMEWTDDWPTPLKLECPDCRELVEPQDVTELEPEQPAKIRARHPQRWGHSKLAS